MQKTAQLMKLYLRPYRILLIPAALFLLLLICSGPALLMRKVVALLLMPAGLIWIVWSFSLFWPSIGRGVRMLLVVGWGLYTFAGSPIAGNRLLQSLEQPYLSFATLGKEPQQFDILFVLGGGTAVSLDGVTPILGSAGDRVLLAARLYRLGKVKTLVASGRSITDIGGDRDLGKETVAIWKDLGIPEEHTVSFSQPRNTREELIEYRNYLESVADKESLRVGILTSAWHLRRTENVWRKLGIEAIPVPADFRSRKIPIISLYLVPQKRGFAHVQLALWEYLGTWFG